MAVSVAENLIEVRKRLKRAARKAGRDVSEITLIAVTKNVEAKRVKEGIKEGLRVFGENYIQEAREKIKKIGDKKKQWHFIGHLQKNKARFAVELFSCIHSIDTPGLARELNRRTTRPIDVLIQVNITGEKTKHGATPDEAVEIARLMPGLKNLNFRGLMAIPPVVESPERSRPYFITIRRLAERINRERIPGLTVHDLSMGMSSDFDIAIEEGATMVRVGTAIFGERESAEKKTTKKTVLTKGEQIKAATEAKSTRTVKARTGDKPKKAKKAPSAAGTKTSEKSDGAKKSSAAPKKKPATAKKKTTPAVKKSGVKASKKTAPKAKVTGAKGAKSTAVKKSAAKKTTVKRKPAAAAPKKKSPKTAKAKTAKAVKTSVLKKTKKTTAPKSGVKKKTTEKKTAAKVTKKTAKVSAAALKKPSKTTKTAAAKAAKKQVAKKTTKTAPKKTKKSAASKKKAV